MPNKVYLRRVEALNGLSSKINSFMSNCIGNTSSLNSSAGAYLNEVLAGQQKLKNMEAKAKANLRYAQSAYNSCVYNAQQSERNNQHTGRRDDCRAEQEEVRRCEKALEKVERACYIGEKIARQAQINTRNLQTEATTLRSTLQGSCSKANQFLGSVSQHAYSYLGTQYSDKK